MLSFHKFANEPMGAGGAGGGIDQAEMDRLLRSYLLGEEGEGRGGGHRGVGGKEALHGGEL
jgi:hypothetical protein